MSFSTPNNNSHHYEPETETIIRRAGAEIIGQTTPRGFGSQREERYQDIYEDGTDYDPDMRPRGGGIGGRYSPPTSNPSNDEYDGTALVFVHNRRGFRLGLQTNPKAFIVIIAIIFLLFNSPHIGQIVDLVIKSLTLGH